MNNRHRGFDPDAFFGPDGPFGPRGPFGITPEMIFGANGPFGSGFGGWSGEENRYGSRRHQGPRPGRGRRARRGDVRNAVLNLLLVEPMNGYQLMQAIADSTDGAWQPSSGAIYPALAQLEDEGLIEQTQLDGRKAYQLTEAGREAAQDAPDLARSTGGAEPRDPWAEDRRRERRHDGHGGSRGRGRRSSGQLWKGLGNLAVAIQALGQTGDEDLIREATDRLEHLRRDLYRLLAESEISRFDHSEDDGHYADDSDDQYSSDDYADDREPEFAEGEIVED